MVPGDGIEPPTSGTTLTPLAECRLAVIRKQLSERIRCTQLKSELSTFCTKNTQPKQHPAECALRLHTAPHAKGRTSQRSSLCGKEGYRMHIRSTACRTSWPLALQRSIQDEDLEQLCLKASKRTLLYVLHGRLGCLYRC